MVNAIKVLNVFSTLLFAAILLLVYSYLPINVDLNVDGVSAVHKQTLFYQLLVAFILINVLVRLLLHFGFRQMVGVMKSWITGLIFIVNFYLTLLVGFIGVWNNSTHISPEGYGYLNYIGPVFVAIWVAGLIFLALRNK